MDKTNIISQESPYDPLEQATVIATGVAFEVYLKDYADKRTEWMEGTIIDTLSSHKLHAWLVDFLYDLIRLYIQHHAISAQAFSESLVMRLDNRGRVPDVFVVLGENMERLQTTYLDGACDLVVEVVSKESIGRDRGIKFEEYAQAGIREYWLIDPIRREAFIYTLDANGDYQTTRPNAEGYLTSSMLKGLRLHPDWLWVEQFPSILDTLKLVQAMQ
jgi:Uma2 family endonuclease